MGALQGTGGRAAARTISVESFFFASLAHSLRVLKLTGTSRASEQSELGELSGGRVLLLDIGSYVLNALVSGSLFDGIPNNKITAFAGESATGKTFFVLVNQAKGGSKLG